jgi:hypothetical protein
MWLVYFLFLIWSSNVSSRKADENTRPIKWQLRSATKIILVLNLPRFLVVNLDLLTRLRARSDATVKPRAPSSNVPGRKEKDNVLPMKRENRSATKIVVPKIVIALVLPRFRSVSWERFGVDINPFDLPGCFALFRNQILIDRTKVVRFQNNTTINLRAGKKKTAEIASWIVSSARSAHPKIMTRVPRKSIPK